MKRIMSLKDLEKRKKCCVLVGGKEIVLMHKDNKIHAFSGFCPHQGGPLMEGKVKDNTLLCPWHGCAFQLESGLCVDTGSCRNLSKEDVKLDKIRCVVSDGEVYIDEKQLL